MLEILLEPFTYGYMINAILACTLIGASCAFLSCFLMLKGWSLIGDALAHSVVPGVAVAYLLGLPYILSAFVSGIFAMLCILFVKQQTRLKEDVVIGLTFTTFFAIGLLIVSINPVAVDLKAIVLGNILSILKGDLNQIIAICIITLVVLSLTWRNIMLIFFDENYAMSIGLPVKKIKLLFFILLSIISVAALQAVGACLVIAMLITPGATAYLLTDNFLKLIVSAVLFGAIVSGFGAYLSYFLNLNPGGLIVSLQVFLFVLAVLFSPKYGVLKSVYSPRPKLHKALSE